MDRLRAIEVFVRVAEAKSFSRAAESLDLANATVTAYISNLERHLGVTLITRDTRRLSLTEEGQRLLEHARELLQSVGRMEDDMRSSLGQLTGSLNVEVPISIGNALLCPALPEFTRRHPDISVFVTLTNQPHHMIEHAIDVAIRMDSIEDADLVARPVFETHYVVCCTPGLARGLPEHPGQLDPRICLGVLKDERRRSNVWRLALGAETVDIQPRGPIHLNSSDALVAAAAAGHGVSHVLDVFAERSIAEGKLVRLFPRWQTSLKTFYIVAPKSRIASAKVRVFTQFLLEILDAKNHTSPDRSVVVRAIGKR